MDHRLGLAVCRPTTARHTFLEMCSFRWTHLSDVIRYGKGRSTSSGLAPKSTISAMSLAERKI